MGAADAHPALRGPAARRRQAIVVRCAHCRSILATPFAREGDSERQMECAWGYAVRLGWTLDGVDGPGACPEHAVLRARSLVFA